MSTLSTWLQQLKTGDSFFGGLRQKTIIAFIIMAGLMALAIMISFRENVPLEHSSHIAAIMVTIGLILAGLSVFIGRRLVMLWLQRRRGAAGARLHTKLVVLFSLIAAIPTILVAIFSALLFDYGVESWFSSRVSTAIKESVAVAEAYLEEHKQTIKADALSLAQAINRQSARVVLSPQSLTNFIAEQSDLRSLSEAIIFNGNGDVVARSALSFVLEFDTLPLSAIEKARNGQVVILTNEDEDRVRALVQLQSLVDAYLYVGRFVDPNVLSHTKQSKEAVEDYESLEVRRFGLQIRFALIFIFIAFILLVGAIWVALIFANQLTAPIRQLISASERVSQGDLSAKVEGFKTGDELGVLSQAFNNMTGQLAQQRAELVDTNRLLDSRRRFTEAVLSGVTAAVIGLDKEGNIQFPNKRALKLLGLKKPEDCVGKPMLSFLPEVEDLIEEVQAEPTRRFVEDQIKVSDNGEIKTYLARLTSETLHGEIDGYVLTIDDITDLITAQRTAAWADVARRLAHEIKNPLTPIQLSAERLKRKYLKQIETDVETFESCTDTIIRQVGNLGQMVDEFSSFARMPEPKMENEDLAKICKEAFTLFKQAHADIKFESNIPDAAIKLMADQRQIHQVLINLLQNSVDAIEANPADITGEITLSLVKDAGQIMIIVVDNGIGLPKENRDRITEPYMTTRKKGTGLGLAIVKKIVEDHNGRLSLEDNDPRGAIIKVIIEESA